MYIFMATFIGLIMNSKCQQTLILSHSFSVYILSSRYRERQDKLYIDMFVKSSKPKI